MHSQLQQADAEADCECQMQKTLRPIALACMLKGAEACELACFQWLESHLKHRYHLQRILETNLSECLVWVH